MKSQTRPGRNFNPVNGNKRWKTHTHDGLKFLNRAVVKRHCNDSHLVSPIKPNRFAWWMCWVAGSTIFPTELWKSNFQLVDTYIKSVLRTYNFMFFFSSLVLFHSINFFVSFVQLVNEFNSFFRTADGKRGVHINYGRSVECDGKSCAVFEGGGVCGNGHVVRIGTQTINAYLRIPQEKNGTNGEGAIENAAGVKQLLNSDWLTCHTGGTKSDVAVHDGHTFPITNEAKKKKKITHFNGRDGENKIQLNCWIDGECIRFGSLIHNPIVYRMKTDITDGVKPIVFEIWMRSHCLRNKAFGPNWMGWVECDPIG